MRLREILTRRNSFTKIPPIPHPPPLYPNIPTHPYTPKGLGPWARAHGPQGLPRRRPPARRPRAGSPWGPWVRAHGPRPFGV